MLGFFKSLLFALFLCQWASAFVVRQPGVSLSTTRLAGMAQPETQIKTKTKIETQTKQKVEIKRKVETGDPVSRREEEFQDAPMFKVMLLEDDGYDAEHVVTRLCGKKLKEGLVRVVSCLRQFQYLMLLLCLFSTNTSCHGGLGRRCGGDRLSTSHARRKGHVRQVPI